MKGCSSLVVFCPVQPGVGARTLTPTLFRERLQMNQSDLYDLIQEEIPEKIVLSNKILSRWRPGHGCGGMTPLFRILFPHIYNYHCWYCGGYLVEFNKNTLQFKHNNRSRDHVIPKSLGGNVTVPCCRACNEFKADMLIEEFKILHLCPILSSRNEFWGETIERYIRLSIEQREYYGA